MDGCTNGVFFALLRSGLTGLPMEESQRAQLDEAMVAEYRTLAQAHDLSHLLALGLGNNGLGPSGISPEVIQAIYRHEQLQYGFTQLCDALEEVRIPFIPLKGAVLRGFYPEPWMRTSCDIDVLVPEPEAERCASYLMERLEYTREETSSHDVSLFSPEGLHVELHYSLVEDGLVHDAHQVLRRVWECATLRPGAGDWYEMPDELFYFYHIAHMAKHFQIGGCGIRSYVDLWILDRLPNADRESRDRLLEEGGLMKFAQASRALSRVWMEGRPHTAVTEPLERYILTGGAYGSWENKLLVGQQQGGGKVRFLLSRLFLPYEVMKTRYPVLEQHPWLLPVLELWRWVSLPFTNRSKARLRELQQVLDTSEAQASGARSLLDSVGL